MRRRPPNTIELIENREIFSREISIVNILSGPRIAALVHFYYDSPDFHFLIRNSLLESADNDYLAAEK